MRTSTAPRRAPMTIRVVVGEDNFLVREGISRALERMDGIELVASNEDLDSLRASVEEMEPDVVLTDIRMPPTRSDEGIRLAADLRHDPPEGRRRRAQPAHRPRLRHDALRRRVGWAARTCSRSGSKDQQELHQALRAVAEGRSLVDSRIVERLLTRTPHSDPQLDRLTRT